MAELFATKGREAHARKDAGNVFSEALVTQLQENQQATRSIHVTTFTTQHEIFHVQELPNKEEFKVDLRHRYCDCGDFQTYQYPCRHVIACCSNQNIDWQVYVNDVYRMDKICKVYERKFEVVGHQSTWPQYHARKFSLTPY